MPNYTESLKKYTELPHNDLIKAVLRNDINSVKLLIESKKFDINAKNHSGQATAILEACFDGNIEMVKLLVENGADYTVVNGGGKSCRDLATIQLNIELYNYLNSLK